MNEYFNNNLENPQFLFHGSPKKLDIIKPHQANDEDNNVENIDNAIFLTSSLIVASAYAFKDSIKAMSSNLNWNFEIGRNPVTNEVFVTMDNVNVDDSLEGFVYVFPFDKTYYHEGRSIQYKCYKNIEPIDIIKVRFVDFKRFYAINQRVAKSR